MSFESFRQQMDSSSSAVLLLYSPQRLYVRGLTLIGVLLTLAGTEGQGAMICLVTGSLELARLVNDLLHCFGLFSKLCQCCLAEKYR
jgi:hypothetical protein